MFPDDLFSQHVAIRVLDFAADYSPWQRRLWSVGSVLALQETSEALDEYGAGVLYEAVVREAAVSARELVRDDPGVGNETQRRQLVAALSSPPLAGSLAHETIRHVVSDSASSYLERWADALETSHEYGPERVARRLAAHILDSGLSMSGLYRRWQKLITSRDMISLADALRSLDGELRAGARDFSVVVAFTAAPEPAEPSAEWMPASEVVTRLEARGHDASALHGARLAGGLDLTVLAMDIGAAASLARDTVENLQVRVDLATRSSLDVVPWVWVEGLRRPLPLVDRRAAEVRAIEREAKLYTLGHPAPVDAALNLVARMTKTAAPGAVGAGWAAIEGLLKAPGDKGAHVAADRLASLVACSYPRAELTTLAWRRIRTHDDALSAAWEALETNRERAAAVRAVLAGGDDLGLVEPREIVGQLRMRELLHEPSQVVRGVEKAVRDTLRRFYRQRNLLLHGGRTTAVALESTLRVAAPLIGAGFDRIAHAWFTRSEPPLRLAVQAGMRIGQLSDALPPDLTALLE